MKIGKTYRFEAAHRLPELPPTHKCHHMHGHNYKIQIEIGGTLDSRGFILDFAELDDIVVPLIRQCDHKVLNDVPGLENPTAELIADWFLKRINGALDARCLVRIYENDDCWAEAGSAG